MDRGYPFSAFLGPGVPCAGASAVIMAALSKLVPVSQIVYGTDYPYRTSEEHVTGLAAIFSADDLKAIDRENALRLMPQLATA